MLDRICGTGKVWAWSERVTDGKNDNNETSLNNKASFKDRDQDGTDDRSSEADSKDTVIHIKKSDHKCIPNYRNTSKFLIYSVQLSPKGRITHHDKDNNKFL